MAAPDPVLPWPTDHPQDNWPYDPIFDGPVRHKILPGLWPLAVPIGELHTLPGNPRRGDVPRMRGSLKRFGQRKNVLVNVETGASVVEAGNHTMKAARAERWTHLAVVKVRDDPETETGYALADNRLGELGGYDLKLLADATSKLKAADPALLLSAGWDDDEYRTLLVSASDPDDPASHWIGMPEFDSENLRAPLHVTVNFANEDDLRSFFQTLGRRVPAAAKEVKSFWWPESDGHRGMDTRAAFVAEDGETDA